MRPSLPAPPPSLMSYLRSNLVYIISIDCPHRVTCAPILVHKQRAEEVRVRKEFLSVFDDSPIHVLDRFHLIMYYSLEGFFRSSSRVCKRDARYAGRVSSKLCVTRVQLKESTCKQFSLLSMYNRRRGVYSVMCVCFP